MKRTSAILGASRSALCPLQHLSKGPFRRQLCDSAGCYKFGSPHRVAYSEQGTFRAEENVGYVFRRGQYIQEGSSILRDDRNSKQGKDLSKCRVHERGLNVQYVRAPAPRNEILLLCCQIPKTLVNITRNLEGCEE